MQSLNRVGTLPPRLPQCRRCAQQAAARTPGGLRCLEHAAEEYLAALDRGIPEWIPKLLPHARRSMGFQSTP